MKIYNVNKINSEELIISGKSDSQIWNAAEVLTDLESPWDSADVKRIEFKSLWNNENMYFSFIVYDSDVHTHGDEDETASIKNSDRVELFFRVDQNLSPYYCLEIDSNSRIMDFKAMPNRDFDFNWNWPTNEINVQSSVESDHFTVEGKITLNSLKDLGLLKGSKLEVGVYRAKYNKMEDSSFEPTWITWVDPNTEEPNFHIKSSFGTFKLIDN